MNDTTRLAVQAASGMEYYKIIDVEPLDDGSTVFTLEGEWIDAGAHPVTLHDVAVRTRGELAVIRCISESGEQLMFVGIWRARA